MQPWLAAMLVLLATVSGLAYIATPSSDAHATAIAASLTVRSDYPPDSRTASTEAECASARDVVERYTDLESAVEDEAAEAKRVIKSAVQISEEVEQQPWNKAQETALYGINKRLDGVLAQIRRADTNIASGYWSKATIYEREWAARSAATLRFIGEPFLKFADGVELVTLSKALGQIAAVDIPLLLHLHQLDSLDAAYHQAKGLLASCSGSSQPSAVAADFFRALGSGEYAVACTDMGPELEYQVDNGVGENGLPCPTVVKHAMAAREQIEKGGYTQAMTIYRSAQPAGTVSDPKYGANADEDEPIGPLGQNGPTPGSRVKGTGAVVSFQYKGRSEMDTFFMERTAGRWGLDSTKVYFAINPADA